MIELRALTKSYGRERGVVDLSFDVNLGEVFGYLGPNGAGKTTTIRTLMDLIRPTSGQASVLGLDPRHQGTELRRRVGYVPGELVLYGDMTAGELLHYFASLRGGVDWSEAERLSERLELGLDRRIRGLSHGNKRKVGLVQAFMHRPELLMLDEPTEGLDPLMQHEFYRMVREVRAEGRTVFLSSHNLTEVERICDRVAIIREGRLVAVEDVGDLKARQLRELELHFDRPAPVERFAHLPGVREATAHGDMILLRMEGSVDPVIKEAARHTVITISAREPRLEDIFMGFYGDEDAR